MKQPSKGWRKVSPKKTSAHHALAKQCSTSCFLDEDRLRFPICPVPVKGKKTCERSCKGLLAAFSRAKQYKHDDIAKKAVEIGRAQGCEWAKTGRAARKF